MWYPRGSVEARDLKEVEPSADVEGKGQVPYLDQVKIVRMGPLS